MSARRAKIAILVACPGKAWAIRPGVPQSAVLTHIIASAIFSAAISVGKLVFAHGTTGKIEASTTRKSCMPLTRPCVSTTAIGSSVRPIQREQEACQTPIYAKFDAELAAALMSINAVKGVEIGAGFGAAELSGEENADEMRTGNNGTRFLSNHAGGVLGGISTGQPVVARFAVKPTSSILSPRQTVDRSGHDTDIMTKGRHDPCVGIRAVPVGEAMMACVLADHFLRHRGQVGG